MKRRLFTTLNHLELDDEGAQRYSLYEVFIDLNEPHNRRYLLIDSNVTLEESTEFVTENGAFDA